jgi:uncharacterized small protein (DUF1192 family)
LGGHTLKTKKILRIGLDFPTRRVKLLFVMQNLALLPIAELESRLAAAEDAIERLSDWAAEIEGEIALYGDSGPGTAKVLAGYRQAVRDSRELSTALREARNVGPFAPVVEDPDAVPF